MGVPNREVVAMEDTVMIPIPVSRSVAEALRADAT